MEYLNFAPNLQSLPNLFFMQLLPPSYTNNDLNAYFQSEIQVILLI